MPNIHRHSIWFLHAKLTLSGDNVRVVAGDILSRIYQGGRGCPVVVLYSGSTRLRDRCAPRRSLVWIGFDVGGHIHLKAECLCILTSVLQYRIRKDIVDDNHIFLLQFTDVIYYIG